jgi:hypothetical protein
MDETPNVTGTFHWKFPDAEDGGSAQMDIGRAFRFVFDDEQWLTKILLGGLVTLIPFVGSFTVSGYSYKVALNTARGALRPLPDWNEFVDLLVRGVIGTVIALVYALPIGVVYACFVTFISLAASGADGGGEGLLIVVSLLFVPLLLTMVLLSSLLGLVAIAHYLASDDVAAAMRVGAVWRSFRAHLGAWLRLLLLGILAGIVAMLGLLALFIGVIFTSFYAYCVIGHGLGQAMRQAGLVPGAPSVVPATSGPPPAFPQ